MKDTTAFIGDGYDGLIEKDGWISKSGWIDQATGDI